MTKYKKVYFRINAPSYYKNKFGVGFENQDEGDKFKDITTQLFIDDGWTVKEKRTSGGCNTVLKDKQELYLHPQSFSGVVLEENIQHIENLLSNSDLFQFERTDIYEDVFDITDEDYIEILKSKQAEIETDILNTFTTKRKNLFITDTWTPINNVLNKYRIKRLTHYIGVFSSSNIDVKFMFEVFNRLVNENKIVTAECKGGTGYRTINKAEQKTLKICLEV